MPQWPDFALFETITDILWKTEALKNLVNCEDPHHTLNNLALTLRQDGGGVSYPPRPGSYITQKRRAGGALKLFSVTKISIHAF